MTALETQKRILILDPKIDTRQEWIGHLREINYFVQPLKSPQEAMSAFAQGKPDLILLSGDAGANVKELVAGIRKSVGKKLPIIVAGEVKGSEGADAFIPAPSPFVDIVDRIESLIGLPSPPTNGAAPRSEKAPVDNRQTKDLEREVEALQEQVNFYQRQLDQVSVVGERETNQIDQVLKDLQDRLDQAKDEQAGLREEISLLKSDLSQKGREVQEKEMQLGHLHEENSKATQAVRAELDSMRKTFNESKEQHKKAQDALRTYYRSKMDNQKKHESSIRELQKRMNEVTNESLQLKKDLEEAEATAVDLNKEKEKLVKDLEKEKDTAKQAKEKLAQLKKALE